MGTQSAAVVFSEEWDWSLLADWHIFSTGLAIFFAGILASAAGIGGGGIFVALLMFLQGLSPHRAVPLSTFFFFFLRGCYPPG